MSGYLDLGRGRAVIVSTVLGTAAPGGGGGPRCLLRVVIGDDDPGAYLLRAEVDELVWHLAPYGEKAHRSVVAVSPIDDTVDVMLEVDGVPCARLRPSDVERLYAQLDEVRRAPPPDGQRPRGPSSTTGA